MPEFTGTGPVTLTVLLNPGSPNGVEQRRGYAQYVAGVRAGIFRVRELHEHRSRGGGNRVAGGRPQRGGGSIARQARRYRLVYLAPGSETPAPRLRWGNWPLEWQSLTNSDHRHDWRHHASAVRHSLRRAFRPAPSAGCINSTCEFRPERAQRRSSGDDLHRRQPNAGWRHHSDPVALKADAGC